MLVQFTLKNYKLFRKETLLDFLPAPINEHGASLLRDNADGEHFLPVILIYGPNGCGKSSMLQALSDLADFVTERDSSPFRLSRPLSCLYNPEGSSLPTEFDVLFRKNGLLFRYQLGLREGTVTAEALFCGRPGSDDAIILFDRREGTLHSGRGIRFPGAENSSPFASLLSRLTEASGSHAIQTALSWFQELTMLPSGITNQAPRLPMDLAAKDALCRLLQGMDIDIRDYRLDYPYGKTEPRLLLSHKDSQGTVISIPYEEESQGTKKLLSLLPALTESLEKGSLFLADDLDSFLHPHLLKALVCLYTNPETNPHGAQLLFTGHNTAILTPSDLRRDSIWLCCRPEGREASLYPLTSYRKENGLIPRNDEAYGKQYLEGRYGAVPRLEVRE